MTLPDDWLCGVCARPRRDCHCPQFERITHEFVGMLRIRNEDRWIAEVIESALNLCARLFILDDHSTDATRDVCARYDRVMVLPSPFAGFNEARDKNWLLDQIVAHCAPQWILCVDGDEILPPDSVAAIREAVENPDCPVYSLRIIFLWNDRQTMRTDWVYGEFWRPSLFRPFHIQPDTPDHIKLAGDLRFMSTPFGRNSGNLHCSSVPQRYLGLAQRCSGGRLLHLGYMHREDRVKKLDFYTACDWRDWSEDCYRHMVQGDDVQLEELPRAGQLLAAGDLTQYDLRFITDLPAEIKHDQIWNGRPLLHAGPLRLEPLV